MIYKKLITIDIDFEDVYINVHHNKTIEDAIDAAKTDTNHVCFAITPENADDLGKALRTIARKGKSRKHAAKVETDDQE